jgi:ribosome-associated protein
MTDREKLQVIVSALDSKKAHDIRIIKVEKLTSLTEYFVLASGSSTTQVKALSDEVEFQMKNKGELPAGVEGYTGSASWVLLDYISIVVHVFGTETRDFYSLERLWQDGEELNKEEFLGGEEK